MLSIAEKCSEEPKHLSAWKRNGWKTREVLRAEKSTAQKRYGWQRRKGLSIAENCLVEPKNRSEWKKMLGIAEKSSA